MSKKKLKTTKDIASEKISKQIQKGIYLYKNGVNIIKKYKHKISPRTRDIFESEFNQWAGFTFELLCELFISSEYAHEFKEKHLSNVEYVDSSWIPDIQYYLEKQLIPKIDYLKMLHKNIQEFDEQISNNESNVKIESNDDKEKILKDNIVEVEKMTIGKLLSVLSISQIFKILSFLIALIIGSFWFGYYVNSWKIDKQKYDLSIENKKVKQELKEYKSILDSISINNNVLDNNK